MGYIKTEPIVPYDNVDQVLPSQHPFTNSLLHQDSDKK